MYETGGFWLLQHEPRQHVGRRKGRRRMGDCESSRALTAALTHSAAAKLWLSSS